MNVLAIAIAVCSALHSPAHASFALRQESLLDFEKRAVAETQQILAQDLDPELPKLPFANWFKQIAGPGAGVIWQLSECGDATSTATGDIRACVEANTILADGRRLILRVAVGTFKRGLTGAPAFQFGVIEEDGELRTIRKLRELPRQLSATATLSRKPLVKLPDTLLPEIRLSANNSHVDLATALGWDAFGLAVTIEEPPPAPQPRTEPAQLKLTPAVDERGVSQGSQGSVITKAEPTYPLGAEKFNASGRVEVRVTISETGRVKNAVAISGHLLLRDAAVQAARKWLFTPTTVNGVPVETQMVLTFDFKK